VQYFEKLGGLIDFIGENSTYIRVISARKATQKEILIYKGEK